jgi:DNA polymerase IV
LSATGTYFRLLGVGISHLEPVEGEFAPPTLDPAAAARARAELAMDRVRSRFGDGSVERGIAFDRRSTR